MSEERLEEIEKRLDHIEKKLRKRAEKRKMDLKEKFRLHDRAQNILRRFETTTWMVNPEQYKDLQEIVKEFAKLVDVALGIKFP